MNQNKKIAILIGTVFSVFAVLLVIVYLGNSKRMSAEVGKIGPEANVPVIEEQGQGQVGDGFLSDSGPLKEDQGEVFDGVLLQKMDGKMVMKKGDSEDELEFRISQDTKITLMKLSLKDDTKKDTEFQESVSITLDEVVPGDNLSIVAKKSEEEKDLYLANEIKKIELSLE